MLHLGLVMRLLTGAGTPRETSTAREATVHTIRVSDAMYREVAGLAILPLRSDGAHQPNGSWLVPVYEDTLEALQRKRLPGENEEDAIMRLVRRYRGQRPN